MTPNWACQTLGRCTPIPCTECAQNWICRGSGGRTFHHFKSIRVLQKPFYIALTKTLCIKDKNWPESCDFLLSADIAKMRQDVIEFDHRFILFFFIFRFNSQEDVVRHVTVTLHPQQFSDNIHNARSQRVRVQRIISLLNFAMTV